METTGRSYAKDSISDILRLTKDPEIQERWSNFCNKILNYELNLQTLLA